MKTKIADILGAAAIMTLVLFLTSGSAILGGQNPQTSFPTVGQAGQPKPAPAVSHSEIRVAIAALTNAKTHLEHAKHNFGGHRGAALKATDEAIRQLLIAQQYDK